MKRVSIVNIVLLADEVMGWLIHDMEGMASGQVYYELVEECELYLKGNLSKEEFYNRIDMIYGLSSIKDLNKILRRCQTESRNLNKFGIDKANAKLFKELR